MVINMGLDMYLTKKYYIGAQYEHNNVTGNLEIFKNGEKIDVKLKDVKYIEIEAVYWRKANMIHKWFVDNVQNGEDDCIPYYVEFGQLRELLDTCIKVRNDHTLAPDLLPTQDGFFFGGTEYSDDYFYAIDYTIKELGKRNLMGEDYSFDYYYESSW